MTIARRPGRPGPPPVRSERYLEGFLNISKALQQAVSAGNHVAHVTAVGIEVGHPSGTAAVVENPWKSFLWRQPRLEAALDFIAAAEVHFDFCQYGEPWQKRTKLRGTHPALHELEKL